MDRPVALLLPGQGSQHQQMAAELYRREPAFAAAVDEVLALMGEAGTRMRADWLSDHPAVDIDDVRRAQPLVFTLDYALAQLVRSWGVEPVAYLGHSAGEVAAAVLAGVLRLPDAVALMTDRVRNCLSAPPGGMLAIAASEQDIRPYLADGVALAAVNGPRQVMLAGPTGPLRAVEARLRADRLTVRPVAATVPFHSPAMAGAAAGCLDLLAHLPLRPPERTVYSGFTGDVLAAADATRPAFWARHLTDPVRFGPALDKLLAGGDLLLVEAGPGQALTALARRHPAVRAGRSAAVPLLPPRPGGLGSPDGDTATVRAARERLRAEGQAREMGS